MQKDVIQKIDLLVEMTDTNNSYETLKEELNLLEKEIDSKKSKINRLKKTMEGSSYLNSSDRIIDENIKIGLENKLASYEQSLTDVLSEIESVSKEEENYHQMILDLEKEIHTSKKFLDSLELKLKTIGGKDKSVYSFYEDLIDTTTKEIKSNETRLQVKKKAYEQVQTRLESYGQKRFDLEEKIQKDQIKLEETKKSLENPDTYVDQKAKEVDELKLQQMEEDLEKDEKRRLEIITDPSFIGHDASQLFVEDDRTSCLDKVKELVTIVHAKPYMDFRYEELDEILENAIQKRDEFANMIDGKKYDGTDNHIVEERIQFLKDQIDSKKGEKENLEKYIRDMDTTMVKTLMSKISDAKAMRDKLRVDIDEYKRVMDEDNEYKTPKKKASLNAAFHRKCEELEQVNQIIDLYENDLQNIVETSKKLESEELEELIQIIRSMEEELRVLEKQKMFDNYANDILAMEKDKSELKKLADEVSKIEHRKKYQKTPNELYDEIEIALSTEDEPVEEVKKEEESVDLNDYRIDTIEEAEEEPIVEEEKSEPELEVPQEENEQDAPIEMDDLVFPPRTTSLEEDSNLLKVIHVEPIEEKHEEQDLPEPVEIQEEPESKPEIPTDSESTQEFMVNDFNDTDYISFNELLEGSMNDGNKD